jgi:uncharacterized protein (TIGR00730 family)
VKKLKKALTAYNNMEFLESVEARTLRILSEYIEPEVRIKKENIESTVVFFGSARIKSPEVAKKELQKIEAKIAKNKKPKTSDFELNTHARMILEMSKYYTDCVELSKLITTWAKTLSSKNKYVICSGGGPGIMEAANKGACLAHGKSMGLNISLPFEQFPNPYITPSLNFEFHYFFMRKLWFLHLAEALIAFPGGFGTLDELMEMLTLVQTKKIEKRIPIILYGSEFWENVVNFKALEHEGMILKSDLELFHYADTPREAFEYLKSKLNK